MIYLNDLAPDQGGETRFLEWKGSYNDGSAEKLHDIRPRAGSALVFRHDNDDHLHEGRELEYGNKYIARSDIMYEMEADPEIVTRYIQVKDVLDQAEEAERAKEYGKSIKLYAQFEKLNEQLP